MKNIVLIISGMVEILAPLVFWYLVFSSIYYLVCK